MQPFTYERPDSLDAAVKTVGRAGDPGKADFVNGGTTMLDLMKLTVRTPDVLVDLKKSGLPGGVEKTAGGVRIGANARMAEVADHDLVRGDYTVVAETLLLAASPQIRNMASVGGNLLQRTRCPYFRHVTFKCNKRDPGSGCDAIGGDNRLLAVLGTSEDCIANYPGDLATSLVALDATLNLQGPDGERGVKLRDFYRLPGDTPWVENALKPGEAIVSVDVPASPAAKNSTYVKARDRASYAFANASAAVGLEMDGDAIKDVRIALGGVGSVPWHAADAETLLIGKPATPENFRAAADAAMAGAKGQGDNDFKIPLAKNVIVRALSVLSGVSIDA